MINDAFRQLSELSELFVFGQHVDDSLDTSGEIRMLAQNLPSESLFVF